MITSFWVLYQTPYMYYFTGSLEKPYEESMPICKDGEQ